MADSFINEAWESAEYDDVILAFLLAEASKLDDHKIVLSDYERRCIEQPDRKNPGERAIRRELLFSRLERGAIMGNLPPDTTWNEVHSLRAHQLDERIFVIFDVQWLNLQTRRPINFRDPTDKWPHPILWGHGREGPFTILEGNTRLTRAAAYHSRDFAIPVYVGLSRSSCQWHTPDLLGFCPLHQGIAR